MKPDEILDLLPWVMQQAVGQHEAYAALVDVMAELQAPAEETLDQIHEYFDPGRTPRPFLPYLASWLDYDWVPDESARAEACRTRRLMEAFLPLTRSRGSVRGLVKFLELATGTAGVRIDEDAAQHHFTIYVPSAGGALKAAIQQIIEREKPAHLTFGIAVEETDDATDICDNQSSDAA